MLGALVMLSGTSAKSIEVKTGISANTMAAAATAKETLKDSGRVTKRSDYMMSSFASVFAEVSSDALMGLGLGVSYAPELVSLNKELRNIQESGTGDSGLQDIAADVDDYVNIYLVLPIGGNGAYVKAGYISAQMNTKENLATGTSYPDIDMTGTSWGAGHEGSIGDNMFWRAEGMYQQWDGCWS